jgi:hypothetical protein
LERSFRQLHEIASWRIMTELIRHCPASFQLIEMHPSGGKSDNLAIIEPNHYSVRIVASYNRFGSIALFSKNCDCADSRLLTQINRNIFELDTTWIVEQALKAIKIAKKKKLPPSTPRILVYRFISTFLSHAAFGKDYWGCRNGMLDTSGFGGGPVEEYFSAFPQTAERRRVKVRGLFEEYPEYRFWFILKNNIPMCCIETNGLLWRKEGIKSDLVKEYKATHSLWKLILNNLSDKM